MIDDICDYCFRDFGRQMGKPAVCLNCGRENVRPRETAMLAPAVENAMARKPQPANPRRKKIT